MLSKYSGLSSYQDKTHLERQFKQLNSELLRLNQLLEDATFGSSNGKVPT